LDPSQSAAVIRYKHGHEDEEARVTTGGFSSKRLARVREVLSRHLDAGYVPGAVAVVARHGEVHIEGTGNLAFEGEGSGTPMAADTICRVGSMSKPIVTACAMTLVEDCTLRLDDPVDELLPELADMTVLADPNDPLEETVPAERPITLRDLLTFTLGTGIVVAEPGTIPIADALNALQSDEPRVGGRVDSSAWQASARLPAG
jgi:CubicO group peptidase (beta-lactamase class C family)